MFFAWVDEAALQSSVQNDGIPLKSNCYCSTIFSQTLIWLFRTPPPRCRPKNPKPSIPEPPVVQPQSPYQNTMPFNSAPHNAPASHVGLGCKIEAFIITHTFFLWGGGGGPYYTYSIIDPPNPIPIIKAPAFGFRVWGS